MTHREHLFIKLTEECAEVQQRVSKLLQFGPDEIQEGHTGTNSGRLISEIYDLLTVVQMLVSAGALPKFDFEDLVLHASLKRVKIAKYLEYSEKLGFVKPDEV